MSIPAILLALGTVTGEEEISFEAKAWRHESVYVLRLYATGPLVESAQEFRTPFLKQIVAGGEKLKQRRGNLDLPEKLRPGDETLRVSTQIVPGKREVEVLERVEQLDRNAQVAF